MARTRQLVLLETSGNQDYIFATNRLRENVGASEQTYRAGVDFVLKAVRQLGGPALFSTNRSTLRDRLCSGPQAGGIEVVIATSGKALLLVDDAAKARDLVGLVTGRALERAPGLDLCGAVSDPFDWERDSMDELVRNLHERFESVRGDRPPPTARFQTLPVVQPCASSGLPAFGIEATPNGPQALSRPVLAKRKATEVWRRRLKQVLPERWGTPPNADRLEQDFGQMPWLAVVHADGNGFGEVFLNFSKYATPSPDTYPDVAARNRAYVDKLRRASVALEEATEAAFKEALHAFDDLAQGNREGKIALPVVPLVLGGDDLTVVCEGTHALELARRFLVALEEQTAKGERGGILPELAQVAHGSDRFAACAGVAIVKHHFPFHHAYELAEELLQSAKTVKKEARSGRGVGKSLSAMDFHVLYDASFTSLSPLRGRLCAADDSRLIARPYLVTKRARVDALQVEARNGKPNRWAQEHHIDDLLTRIEVIAAKDQEDGRTILPGSQVHALREALFRGKPAADAELRQMFERYGPPLAATGHGLTELIEDTGDPDARTLFRRVVGPDGNECWETRFLDALDTVGFWEGRER
jgi:hypothetical protein